MLSVEAFSAPVFGSVPSAHPGRDNEYQAQSSTNKTHVLDNSQADRLEELQEQNRQLLRANEEARARHQAVRINRIP